MRERAQGIPMRGQQNCSGHVRQLSQFERPCDEPQLRVPFHTTGTTSSIKLTVRACDLEAMF